MSLVTLKAHFDSQHVCLDEPIVLPPNTKLMVTVWLDEKQGAEAERQAWLAASQAWLAGAYGDHEPDYSETMLREEPRRE